MSISGDVAISGAPRRNHDTGVAYVFQRFGGSWHQVQQIQASDGQIDDWFGSGVGISGNTLIVHAAFGDPGSAYVFRLVDNTWQEQAILTATDDGLGSGDTAISGQTVIIGVMGDDDMGTNAGSAYIFVVQESCCPWDLDGSGAVGITDFLDLLAAWGTDPGGPPDFNGDGNVGIQDFLELLANWGPCP